MNRPIHEYENKIVIFIDILGTKSLVEKTVTDDETLSSLVTVLDGIPEMLKHISKQHNQLYARFFREDINLNIQTSHFSDSYVISFSVTQENLFHSSGLITDFLQAITERFLRLKILLRGGVTYGKVIHTDNVLFGPAMVEAYALESKLAHYPRIIFSESIMKHISNCLTPTEDFDSVVTITRLKKDQDGFYFYNYADVRYLSNSSASRLNNLILLLDCLKEMNSPELNEKYTWLKMKLIEFSNQVSIGQIADWLAIEDTQTPYSPQNRDALSKAFLIYKSAIEKLKAE